MLIPDQPFLPKPIFEKFPLSAIVAFAVLQVLLFGCIPTEPSSEGKKDGTVETGQASVETDAEPYEALSLLGKKLKRPELSDKQRAVLEENLAKAKANFDAYPDSLDFIIWYGRRLAYMSMYKEAIQVYTDGLREFPDSYRIYRHRGHRYISIRQFDDAIRDLEKAAFYMRGEETMIEKDGIPNKLNIPLSSTQFNVWYHLGLAYYLKGNYDKAISAYKKCMEFSTNDDLLVATSDWMYITYRKLGNLQAADKVLEAIKPKMKIIENDSYHKRLLMYKGLLKPEDVLSVDEEDGVQLATQGYGVANWYLLNGNIEKGRDILQKVVDGESWSAFGYIASEVELTNLQALL
ncbi:MAG: tetratricopeptide repeat protein [Imperialibacter sp.]|uniref:tetratricopeptide repeat protein n=1 Tax=Imperialibacter sp. TaxID=2038411 RepID=UPI0032EAB39D